MIGYIASRLLLDADAIAVALKRHSRDIHTSAALPGDYRDMGFSTTAIHSGNDPEQWACQAVVPPIVTSTTFKWKTAYEAPPYYYTRSGNPNRNVLEECLAAIECAKHCVTFASGAGAITTIVHLLNAGEHVVASADLYGGTTSIFNKYASNMGIKTSYADFTRPETIEEAIQENTKMVWFETPTNPLLKLMDIKKVVEAVRCKPGILIVLDNTFATPYFQRPLDLGVDITMLSVTKYMNGHSDVIMGSAATNNDEVGERLKLFRKNLGVIPSPFDCYLVNRSLKTLALRLERHKTNSLAVANWMSKHPNVTNVYHPGLKSNPQREIYLKQCTGHTGIFSFEHNKGKKETEIILKNLNLFSVAFSLGGYESLAAIPAVASHRNLSPEERQAMGVTDGLIRLSIGLEDEEDLINDFEQAFAKAFGQ